MSNKTLKKRIAAVAASALTAGFLSVVAMPAANAAAGDFTVTAVTGQVAAPSVTAASAGTATITTTGSVTLAVAAVGSVAVELRVSGGTFTSVTSGATINDDGSVAFQTTVTGNGTAISGLVAKPTTAGRNMVIKSYASANNKTTDALAVADAAASVTPKQSLTVTVVAPGTNGVFSAGFSAIAIVNAASTSSSATNADTPYANIVGAGGYGVISYALKDVNNRDLPSTAIVYASLKSGACIVGDDSTDTTGTFVVGASPADLIYVRQADQVNTPATTCVVDITVDGVLAATKTFTLQGPVAAITVTGLGIGATSADNTGLGYLVATDSAGNQIGGVSVSGIILDSAKSGIVSAATIAGSTARIDTNFGIVPATVPVTVGWNCGATAGTAPVVWRVSNGVGGFITSPTYNVTCAGNPVTYTASLDKASYVPGDIATLTITGKGSKGELANDKFVIDSGSTGGLISMTGSQMSLVGTVAKDTTFTAGVKTYKFVVGTTEGSYNMVVDIPLILTATNKATYGAATQTVAYKVASGSTAVTNAEVLAAIVKLIASINKQIRALQKSLRR